MTQTNLLAATLKLPCGATLANRLCKAAMTEGLADENDNPGTHLNTLYQQWSEGGAGLLITGNVMVDRRYLERPGNVVMDAYSDSDAMRRWASACTKAGNHAWVQISHVGRQCNRASGHQPISPSDVGLRLMGMFRRPRAMTADEIATTIDQYAFVAEMSKQAGFTGVQVHAAHGYLISQFLSPRINQREDQWGGTLENRARFLLEVVRKVRATVGSDFPVGVKLNSADFQKGGFSHKDSMAVAQMLEAEGIDLLEISGGNYEQPQLLGHEGRADSAEPPKRESTKKREAYFLEYAEAIREQVSMPMMVTGGFRSRSAMEDALNSGAADVIGLGRPLCVDPDAPLGLLDGSCESLISWEHQLPLGKGLFGPTSSLLLMRMIHVQGEVAWFYRQLEKLARDQNADRKLGLLKALWQHTRDELTKGKRRTFLQHRNNKG